MDLQAVRYAAMVANMTFEQAVEAHAHYLTTRGLTGDAEARLLAHLHAGDSRPELNSGRPRIMLVAGGFSAELTTSVLWLNDSDLDLTCVKVQLYRLGEEEVLNVEQIIPLPEAQDYMVQLRKKVEESESTLYPEVPWTYEDIAVLRQSISNPHLVALFDLCSRRPGEFVAMSEVVAQSGQTPAQARGAMGGFTTLVRGRFKRGNWPIDAEWNAGGDYQAYYRLSPEIAGWWRQAGETSPATPPGVASDLTVVESL